MVMNFPENGTPKENLTLIEGADLTRGQSSLGAVEKNIGATLITHP